MLDYTALYNALENNLNEYIGLDNGKELSVLKENIKLFTDAFVECFPEYKHLSSLLDDSEDEVLSSCDEAYGTPSDSEEFIFDFEPSEKQKTVGSIIEESNFAKWIERVLNIIETPALILGNCAQEDLTTAKEAAKHHMEIMIEVTINIYKKLTLSNQDDNFDFLFDEIFKHQNNSYQQSYSSQVRPMLTVDERFPRLRRHSNILLYNRTRVQLGDDNGAEDFIAANHIHDDKNHFIATQAPLASKGLQSSETRPNFWRMVLEQDSNVIVMLTKIKEDNVYKADVYWPDCGESIAYQLPDGNLTVTLDDSDVLLNTTVEDSADDLIPIITKRSFTLNWNPQQGNVTERQVVQLHYEGWPDHGIPTNSDAFFKLMAHARYYNNSSHKPVITHCSAGIGRTGVWIGIHAYEALLSRDTDAQDEANIASIPELARLTCGNISKQRRERHALVQTAVQFNFIINSCRELSKNPKLIDNLVDEIASTSAVEIDGLDDLGSIERYSQRDDKDTISVVQKGASAFASSTKFPQHSDTERGEREPLIASRRVGMFENSQNIVTNQPTSDTPKSTNNLCCCNII